MTLMNKVTGPHHGQPLILAGEPLAAAQAAMIMVHGRGASARDILSLTEFFDGSGFAYLAPQAAGYTWYPYSFLSPLEQNEPFLSSALEILATVLERVTKAGIPPEKIILLGFSQGACLSAEFAARNACRYGGLAILSGGLIGPPETAFAYNGSLAGTPVFLGCSDVDFHIPQERVQESTRVLRDMGADVTERLYPGMGHTINQDEIDFVVEMMSNLNK
jgi:phospholipase/carboxylesterase